MSGLWAGFCFISCARGMGLCYLWYVYLVALFVGFVCFVGCLFLVCGVYLVVLFRADAPFL